MSGSTIGRGAGRVAGAGALAAALALSACTSGGGRFAVGGHLTGRNYSYAVYDSADALLHTPIDPLRREIEDRRTMSIRPITDVFVIAHGWNFTVEESFELYEGYRHSLEPMLDLIHAHDPKFDPYFIFVVWSSVSRPVTDSVRSVLPWTPPAWLDATARAIDTLAFHLPSNWGESQDAVRIALGQPTRWNEFRPDPAAPPEYATAIERGLRAAEKRGFHGFQAPLSVLLDELIAIRGEGDAGATPRLHVVGHSFGGKLASLAAFDAVQRRLANELVGGVASAASPAALIDSLIVINPAMQLSEMFWELPLTLTDLQAAALRGRDVLRDTTRFESPSLRFDVVARRIGTKALLYSRHDSANGWLFAVGDLILDHDAVSAAQQEILYWRPLDELVYGDDERSTLGQVAAAPFALVYGTLQLAVRASYGLLGTVFSDLSAVVDGPITQCREIGEDWPHAGEMALDVLGLPLSPLTVQRSCGNQGLRHVRSAASLIDPFTWLDGQAARFLEESTRLSPEVFLAATSEPGARVDLPGDRFLVCDARDVFNGALAQSKRFGPLLNFVPPGAHGDIRSMDRVADPGDPDAAHPDGLEKRLRTFLFVYTVTRGARPPP